MEGTGAGKEKWGRRINCKTVKFVKWLPQSARDWKEFHCVMYYSFAKAKVQESGN